MATVRIGGDPENYMEAPQISASDGAGGAGNFIASLLDAVGIGRQVAKEPEGAENPEAPATTQSVPAPVNLPSLDIAETAFRQSGNSGGDWGKNYLQGLKPLKSIDPGASGF